ncbi:MAG: alkaline phosphatase family protein, partial [Sphingomonadales bacterium]|nr:alkaline phosphatase family protein [Sphingomonadales bacterium]
MKVLPHVAASLLLLAAYPVQARSLLLISVDALRADYIREAEKHGIKVPNLRRLMAEGSYAQGVRPTVPSITFPSHITLVTGVQPNRHGIVGNDRFDPTAPGAAPQYWFARDITADTLWQAAARAGLSTGSLGWPITAGQTAIRYNVPHLEPYESAETVKLQEAMARPDGFLAELESKLGSFYQDSSENGSR